MFLSLGLLVSDECAHARNVGVLDHGQFSLALTEQVFDPHHLRLGYLGIFPGTTMQLANHTSTSNKYSERRKYSSR